MPIRIRLMLAFGAAVALLVAAGGWLFVVGQSRSMLGSIDAQLSTAAGIADRYTTSVSGRSSSPGSLPGEYLLQILGPGGQVTASGQDAGTTPLVPSAMFGRAASRRIAFTRSAEDEPVRVVAEPYVGHPGYVAAAAVSLDAYRSSVGTLERSVIAGGIAVLVVAVSGSYLLARRALAPVERMRREVAALVGDGGERAIRVPSTRDELATLARTMNDLLGRLHASLERQRAFVADASHELRTPLSVLGAELELASRPGRTKEELSDAVASAAEETARLMRLAEDLLLLARSDSDRLELRLDRVDVGQILERGARAAERRARSAGVQIVLSAREGCWASLDAVRLREALDNLLDNALRFAPPGTTVEVRGTEREGLLSVEVLDRGPGFPGEYLPHAFERFRRPTSDRSRSDGGSGLGLAIVEAIARAHGGAATARNRDGGGAAVRLEIPTTSSALAPDDLSEARRADAAWRSATGRSASSGLPG